MMQFLKLTFSDIQCLMYYFVLIGSSLLLYTILIAQGYFDTDSLEDVVAVILVLPVMLLVMLPFIYKRYKILNNLLKSNNRIRVNKNEYRFHVGILLIQCSIKLNGVNKDIILIGSKSNRQLVGAGEFNLIVDSNTGEVIVYEAYI